MIANYGDDSMSCIISGEHWRGIRRGAKEARKQDAESQPLREILIRDKNVRRIVEVGPTNFYSRTDLDKYLSELA